MTAKKQKLFAILGSAAVLTVATALIVVFTGGAPEKPSPAVTDNGGGTVSVGDITDKPDTAPDAPQGSAPDTGEIKIPDIDDKSDEPQNTDVPGNDPVLDIDGGEDVNVNVNLSDFDEDKTPPAPPKVNDDSALTNPDVKPSYEDKQTTVTPGSDTPKNGDKKPGYIYIEGFGWIADEGGQAQGEIIDSDGDINKQVGNMG